MVSKIVDVLLCFYRVVLDLRVLQDQLVTRAREAVAVSLVVLDLLDPPELV